MGNEREPTLGNGLLIMELLHACFMYVMMLCYFSLFKTWSQLIEPCVKKKDFAFNLAAID